MKAGVISFPGSNCDRDLRVAFDAFGMKVVALWHKETCLPEGIDIIALPGGFSYGDYLRCGAIAAHSPICREVKKFADRGGYVLGVCNGFQILCEMGLLPGGLLCNAGIKFLGKSVMLRVGEARSVFTAHYTAGDLIEIPIAHHDGNYFAAANELESLEGESRIAFRYAQNPNGSARDIAGIVSTNRRILGMMPHPERAIDPLLGSKDGGYLFHGLAQGFTQSA